MHRVFVSYHHANDQLYKDQLLAMNKENRIFEDYSVNSGEIDDEFLSDEEIRTLVRDEYLRESTVTVVLVGTETRYRKHVDWELYSSMRDSPRNKKSGIILVSLPDTGMTSFSAAHGDTEKTVIYPETTSWAHWNRSEYEQKFPYASTRMIDNLASGTAKMSVVPWSKIESNPANLSLLIELAHQDRESAVYDFSTAMRRRNG